MIIKSRFIVEKNSNRINNEKITVEKMVLLYCKKHHNGSPLCDECKELINYSHLKLDKCTFGELKPACSKCSVHCYKPLLRKQIREIMRYSGPRMIYNHPLIAIKYMINKIK
ncbi:MAG: nitrous oxide-stimulated promoter family protein [Candidatus Humimicrobiaceae bacterium]